MACGSYSQCSPAHRTTGSRSTRTLASRSSGPNVDNTDRIAEDSSWSKIDVFELRHITNKTIFKLFYIIFFICLALLLVSVILLLIPKNSTENENQTALEERILMWTYSKQENIFKDSAVNFDLTSNPKLGMKDYALRFATDYDYPVDKYYVTYEDRTYVRDATKDKEDPEALGFSFEEKNLPVDSALAGVNCVRVRTHYSGVKRELEGQLACGSGKAVPFIPLIETVTNLAQNCSTLTTVECKKVCSERKGLLKLEGSGYNCYQVKVAKIFCVKVEVTKDKLRYTGGCFYEANEELYAALEPGQTWRFEKTVRSADRRCS